MEIAHLISSYETQLFTYLIPVILTSAHLTYAFIRQISRKSVPDAVTTQNAPESGVIRSALYRRHYSVFVVLQYALLTVSVTALIMLHLQVPKIIRTNPASGSYLTSFESPVEFEFNIPVDMSKLNLHETQILPGVWQKVTYGKFIPFGRIIRFIPSGTAFPDQKIMFYISNISKPFAKKFGGEYLLETFTPKMPYVATINPSENSEDVATDVKITGILNRPLGSLYKLSADIQPSMNHNIRLTDGKTVEVSFPEGLQQGVTYKINIYALAVVYNFNDQRILETGSKTLLASTKFSTVKPPLILSVNPQGNAVIPDKSTIEIHFEQPMDQKSVQNNFKLIPHVNGIFSWDNDGTRVKFYAGALDRDTVYMLRLDQGVTTKNGGVLHSPFEYKFKTLGSIDIITALPQDPSADIPSDTEIRITFDQDVDHASAERNFTIKPNIIGSFEWEGKTMIFKPSERLAISTKYRYKLVAGINSINGNPSVKDYEYSFTTGPETYTIKVPLFRQQELFTCNIAASRIMLAYRGVDISESRLKSEIGTSGSRGNGNPHKGYVENYGTYWEPIKKAVEKYRPVRIYQNWSIDDIISQVKNGNPVMIWGQNGWSDPHEISWTASDGTFIYAINGMHSYVVIGFRGPAANPTHILINDPWRGKSILTMADFLARWKYLRTAMVVE